jgi:hypothetical protein
MPDISRGARTAAEGSTGRVLPASKARAGKHGDQIAVQPPRRSIPVDGTAITLDRNDPKRSAEIVAVGFKTIG